MFRYPPDQAARSSFWMSTVGFTDRGGTGNPCSSRELDMLLHPPSRLVQTILDGITDARESFQVRGIESEEIWIVGNFDNQGVAAIEHRTSLHFLLMPAA